MSMVFHTNRWFIYVSIGLAFRVGCIIETRLCSPVEIKNIFNNLIMCEGSLVFIRRTLSLVFGLALSYDLAYFSSVGVLTNGTKLKKLWLIFWDFYSQL